MGEQEVIEYRLAVLEKSAEENARLIREMHDAIITIKARLGEGNMQCGIHNEKMQQFEKRIDGLEKERDAMKKWVYKVGGGMAVVGLIFSNLLAPIAINHFSPSSPKTITIGTNTYTIK